MRQTLGRAGLLLGRELRAVCSPSGLRGAAVELTWITAHVATYPMGFLRERARDPGRFSLTRMSPVSRGLVIGSVEAAGTPILLVHGLVDNRSIFALLRRGLRRRGFGLVRTVNYPLLTSDIRGAAVRLAGQVEQTCRETGYERIHVVGHSLGGLIARYYVQRLAGDERVHTLVTLGTPHSGTRAAHLLPRSLCGQLRPGSDVLTELAGPAAGCATRFLCFWTDLDQLVLPRDSARLDHPDLLSRNVLVSGVGHLSLPINGRVVREICHALAHLDADGTTRTPGVTPLARRPNPPALRTAPRRRAARRSAGEAG